MTTPPLPDAPFPEDRRAGTQEADLTGSERTLRTYPCPACGADLEFEIEQRRLSCPYCGEGRELTPPEQPYQEQDYYEALETLKEQRSQPDVDLGLDRQLECDSCGAIVNFHGHLTSQHCAYCGTPIQKEFGRGREPRLPIDAVLPFHITKDRADQALGRWVQSRWFAPNDFKRHARGNLAGIYLPFWTYDCLTHTSYSGQRGNHYWVTVGSGKEQKRVRRTRWWPASGQFRKFFDDVLVIASQSLSGKIARRLEPWPLGHCVPANPEVVAGFLAEQYQVPLERGFSEASQRIQSQLRTDVKTRIGGDEQRIHSMNVDHLAIHFKSVLLPVWLLGYQYQDCRYQVAVNAGTGEVQGNRPYSWIKIGLFAATLAGIAFTVWKVGFER